MTPIKKTKIHTRRWDIVRANCNGKSARSQPPKWSIPGHDTNFRGLQSGSDACRLISRGDVSGLCPQQRPALDADRVTLKLKRHRIDELPRGLACTCVALARALAGRSRFDLPRPTGPMPVGTLTLTLVRPSELDGISAGRFGVQVWYPAEPSTGRAPYGSGAPGIKRWIYHRLVKTHAAQNVPFAARYERAPIVVYVAGWGGEGTDNTVLVQELASHGFVVAAIGDLRFEGPPPSRLAGPLDLSSTHACEATLRLARDKMAFDALRVSAVLDRLALLDAADPAAVSRIGSISPVSVSSDIRSAAPWHSRLADTILACERQ
jgi:hypothetical protein